MQFFFVRLVIMSDVVLYTQQRIFIDDDGDGGRPPVVPSGDAAISNLIRTNIFQPIAGGRLPDEVPPVAGILRGMQFGLLDAETTLRMASTIVTNPACVEQPRSLMDLRMGASAVSNLPCESCHENHHNCPGHFGCIRLPMPVVNPLFVGMLVGVLNTLCVACCRLRLSPHYINAMVVHRAGTGLRLLRRLKAIAALCVRQTHCRIAIPSSTRKALQRSILQIGGARVQTSGSRHPGPTPRRCE